MDKQSKRLRLLIIIIVVIVIGIILYFVFRSNVFNSDINYSFDEALEQQFNEDAINTKEVDGNFVEASREDVKQAMTISRQDNNLKYMDITETVPISEEEVNRILKDKGILEDQGKAFIEAQDKYHVNIIYLMSHALVETGNGKSQLARGIKYKGERYYNFFGIGAFDSSAVESGQSYAQQEAWTSPRKAILGGAKFIRNEYFDNQQVTLYQMRWNPESPGEHQYASDIRWTDNIADLMDKYYKELGIKKDDIRRNFYQ